MSETKNMVVVKKCKKPSNSTRVKISKCGFRRFVYLRNFIPFCSSVLDVDFPNLLFINQGFGIVKSDIILNKNCIVGKEIPSYNNPITKQKSIDW